MKMEPRVRFDMVALKIGVMAPQGQDCRQPPAAGPVREGILPKGLPREQGPAHSLLSA